MNCPECNCLMDQLAYDEQIWWYECPACDTLKMEQSSRSALKVYLESKGLQENTPEFDAAIEKIMGRERVRKYDTSLPSSDPDWKDPFPEDEGFGV